MKNYTIGRYALREIKRITFGLGKKYLIMTDKHVSERVVSDITDSFLGKTERGIPSDNIVGRAAGLLDSIERPQSDYAYAEFEFYEMQGKTCSCENAKAAAEKIKACGADVIVAVGGSKCLDLARAATHYVGAYARPAIVMCPTVVSSNACATGMSVMYDEQSRGMSDFWSLASMPECVIIDTDIIVNSPVPLFVSAIGDQISSSMEALHTLKSTGEYNICDRLCIAHHRDVLDVLEKYSRPAVKAMKTREVTHEFEWVCHAVTRYTGPELAVGTAYLSHILDEALAGLPELSGWMHGDIVGYGTLPDMVAAGEEADMYRWVDMYREIGIPVTLKQLGLGSYRYKDILALCRRSENGVMATRAMHRWDPREMAAAVITADELVNSYIGEREPSKSYASRKTVWG